MADYDDDGQPSVDDREAARAQLSLLATSAAEEQAAADGLADDLENLKLSSQSSTADTATDRDSLLGITSPESSSNSSSSNGDASSQTSALAFLRASFPNIPVSNLKQRLQSEQAAGDFSMQHLVEDLLSEEYVRDLEERGLSDEAIEAISDNTEGWMTVSRVPRKKPLTPKKKAAKGKGRTVVINDVRQQRQNIPRLLTHSAGDPWNQVLSISTYLSSLLPRPQTFFASYLHKPEYSTPSDALRAALTTIKDEAAAEGESQSETLLSLLEFIVESPEYDYDNLTPGMQNQLCADIELCLGAAKGSPEDALDVLKLLQELEGDDDHSMGFYHTPATSPRVETIQPRTKAAVLRPLPPAGPSLGRMPAQPALPPPSKPASSGTNTWHEVPIRPKAPLVHPLAAHIPAYNTANVPRKKSKRPPLSANPHNTLGIPRSPTSRGRGVLGVYRSRIEEARSKHDEALRTASRHWNNGSGKNRGGEIALYYALEAQRHQAEARKLQLDALREHVESKRFACVHCFLRSILISSF